MTKKKGVHTGKIGKDDKNNYFCGQYLLDYKSVESGKFNVGDIINIKSVIANPSNASNEQYPMKSSNFFLANDKPHPDTK